MEGEIITDELIGRIRLLEGRAGHGPAELAGAIVSTKWGRYFWDRQCFLNGRIPDIRDEVSQAGLDMNDGSMTVAGTDQHWLHFLAPIAAYRTGSRRLGLLLLGLSLDPGIGTRSIRRRLGRGIEPSFWYSVGGDRLHDSIAGSEQPDEYRADILGLRSLEEYERHPSMRLSEMAGYGRELMPSVSGDSFRSDPYFTAATEHINPRYSHRIARAMGKRWPCLCRRGLIPLDHSLLP